MANAVEVRDPYTAGHQRRVAGLAAAIARELGLNEEQIHGLKLAATIHDLGKLQVPMEILNKPGKLTQLEYQLIQTHVQAGFDIVKDVSFPWPIAEMILQHHERLDGSGYPRGLKADQMLLESKILAVADMVEAMVSHRPYRAAVGLEVALAEIIKGRGGVFDAAAVDVCVKLLRDTGSEAFKILEP
jgi:putative nucleotidyltransferase with HDIG domain